MRVSHGRGHRVLMILLILVLLGVIAYLSLVGMVCWKENHVPPMDDYDAIIVLGCQVKPDGTPNLQLQWRLDAAYAAWLLHPCRIVVTGGQGKDEPRAEGAVMYDYLLKKGVPADQLLCDDRSVNTRQNLRAAAGLLDGAAGTRVLIVTSDYHLPRAIAMAEDEGFTASGVASQTLGGWYWIKNHAREALSWVKYWAEKYLGYGGVNVVRSE